MLVPYLTILTLQSFQPELNHFSQRLFPLIIAIKRYFPIVICCRYFYGTLPNPTESTHQYQAYEPFEGLFVI